MTASVVGGSTESRLSRFALLLLRQSVLLLLSPLGTSLPITVPPLLSLTMYLFHHKLPPILLAHLPLDLQDLRDSLYAS